MIRPGLVSITFRELTPREIVDLVCRTGIRGIEWGGDIHVPHGDLEAAREVGKMTRDAGLENVAYGSYYRIGASEKDGLSFESVLDTAFALETGLIRVWAGCKPSAEADERHRKLVADESIRIADLASARGVTLAYEWHMNTLTDDLSSGVRLLEAVSRPNVKTFWQPTPGLPEKECKKDLLRVLDHLSNLHVYHWVNYLDREPLSKGEEIWGEYFSLAGQAEGDRFALLEFVPDDSPDAFLEDAKTLCELLDREMV